MKSILLAQFKLLKMENCVYMQLYPHIFQVSNICI